MSQVETVRESGLPEVNCAPLPGEGLRPSPLARLLVRLYAWQSRRARAAIRSLLRKREGARCLYVSLALREIFARYHGVEIGLHSHGHCFEPGAFPPGTRIGRYCSIASGVRAMTANHPMNLKSSHAYFFNPTLGMAQEPLIPRHDLVVGNDVWIGHNALLLPAVHYVGDGAVIGAGAVVGRNVPPYAVVTGNPARVVRHRFSAEHIAELREERWWDRPLDELVPARLAEFQSPIEGDEVR